MNLEKHLEGFKTKLSDRKEIHKEAHWIKRLLWVAAGILLVGAGLAMLVLPGPGLLVIAIGLAILALEFAWAEWLLHRALQGGLRVTTLLSLRRIILLLLLLAALSLVLFLLLS